MTSIGFTGTRQGMTSEQASEVLELLHELKPKHVHHGDCVGADEQFHTLALLAGAIVHVHPPTKSDKRAFCGGDITYTVAPYLKRNRNIVNMSDALIATPKEYTEKKAGSGTWATIRYARQKNIAIYIVYPDGEVAL